MKTLNTDSQMTNPTYFYKYYSVNNENFKFIEKIFTHNELRFPSPKEFNDPFDSKIQLCYDGSNEDWKKYLGDLFCRYAPQISIEQKEKKITNILKEERHKRIPENLSDSYLDKIGVFCMSEKKDHLLLWSHYAQGHTGFCLEFQSNSPFFVIAQKVKYNDKYPKVNFFNSSRDEQMQTTLLTKSKIWEYEQEWRIINHDKGPGIYNFSGELLTGVIFGCKILEEYKQQIKKLTSDRKIQPKLYQAEVKKDKFGINIIEIGLNNQS